MVCLFGHAFVEVLAGFVVLVYLVALFQSYRKIFFYQQIHRLFSVLNSSGRIDTRSYFKNDIANRNIFLCQAAYVDNGF